MTKRIGIDGKLYCMRTRSASQGDGQRHQRFEARKSSLAVAILVGHAIRRAMSAGCKLLGAASAVRVAE